MSENSSDKESEADSINENPIIFEHLFTPKLKDTESDLTPKRPLYEEIMENETIENLQKSVFNMNAEIIALKRFVKEELRSLNKYVDRVRTEQCNQTDFMEETKKMLEESKTKTEILKTLSENVNTITNAYRINRRKKNRGEVTNFRR